MKKYQNQNTEIENLKKRVDALERRFKERQPKCGLDEALKRINEILSCLSTHGTLI